ncbi:Hypothetical protein AT6N2_L0501 [Agrobacterium tumefaciens]|nr:Hypothetical protein AT6N2_L0501 [Agrobacterium tumefaciens]
MKKTVAMVSRHRVRHQPLYHHRLTAFRDGDVMPRGTNLPHLAAICIDVGGWPNFAGFAACTHR